MVLLMINFSDSVTPSVFAIRFVTLYWIYFCRSTFDLIACSRLSSQSWYKSNLIRPINNIINHFQLVGMGQQHNKCVMNEPANKRDTNGGIESIFLLFVGWNKWCIGATFHRLFPTFSSSSSSSRQLKTQPFFCIDWNWIEFPHHLKFTLQTMQARKERKKINEVVNRQI